jgi:hypothetical protein
VIRDMELVWSVPRHLLPPNLRQKSLAEACHKHWRKTVLPLLAKACHVDVEVDIAKQTLYNLTMRLLRRYSESRESLKASK